MKQISAKIISNKEISEGIFKLKLAGDFQGAPGQFYMLRAWEEEPVLSRPISISDIEENSITFLYQIIGRGTKIISKLEIDDSINIQGPLGNTFPVEKLSGKVAIITGGVGIAPDFY